MPHRQQINQEKIETNHQKLSWKQNSRYKTYANADSKRKKLIEEGNAYVKVRRCGPGGTQFKVVVGTSLESKNKKPKKDKGKNKSSKSKDQNNDTTT